MPRHKNPNALTSKNTSNITEEKYMENLKTNNQRTKKTHQTPLKCLILGLLFLFLFPQVGFIKAEYLGKEIFKLITMFNAKTILCYHFRALYTLTLEKCSFLRFQV